MILWHQAYLRGKHKHVWNELNYAWLATFSFDLHAVGLEEWSRNGPFRFDTTLWPICVHCVGWSQLDGDISVHPQHGMSVNFLPSTNHASTGPTDSYYWTKPSTAELGYFLHYFNYGHFFMVDLY